jgi:gas vesicle protein
MEQIISMVLEALKQIIPMILGALISAVIGALNSIYIDKRKAKTDRKNKHFQDLQRDCLSPLKGELLKMRGHFEYNGDKHPPPAYYYENLLSKEVPWWDSYSLRKVGGLLFEDLVNHFSDLYNRLVKIDSDFKNKYPSFIRAVANLKRKLYDDMRVRELCPGEDLSWRYRGMDPWIVDAIFYLAIGLDKEKWLSLYENLKNSGKLEDVLQIAKDYIQSEESEIIRSISKEMGETIESCLKEIDEILHMTKLPGKCKYIQ